MSFPPELYFECFPWHCAAMVTGLPEDASPTQDLFGSPRDEYPMRDRRACVPGDNLPHAVRLSICAQHHVSFFADDEEGCLVCRGLIDPPNAEAA
jgi:hypothetical protein